MDCDFCDGHATPDGQEFADGTKVVMIRYVCTQCGAVNYEYMDEE